MFRRIEFLHESPDPDGLKGPGWVGGIMFPGHELVAGTEPGSDEWLEQTTVTAWDALRGATRGGHPGAGTNARFYFTEKGWRECGREIVRRAQRNGVAYRVRAVKETDAQVAWRDKFTGLEVALQPARRR